MNISFDYDGTFYKLAKIAKKLVDDGEHDIAITTRRYKKADNSDLFAAAKKAGITKIHFNNGILKYQYLADNNFDLHVDDNQKELDAIKKTNVVGINIDDFMNYFKKSNDKIKTFNDFLDDI
jgi:hypothetical protein